MDIARLRHLEAPVRDARLFADLAGSQAGGLAGSATRLRLKIYQHGGALPLSDAVPALENFGFRVLAEVASELGGDDPATIHDFTLALEPGLARAPILARAPAEEEALRQTVAHAGLADGQSILELGCGWGSLSLWMARR